MKIDYLLRIVVLGVLFTTFLFAEQMQSKLNLLPVPEKVELQQGKLRLNNSFSVTIKTQEDKRLQKAVVRFLSRLSGRTGLYLEHPKAINNDNVNSEMVIQAERSGKLELYEDESYQLSITEENVSLTAKTDIGALRGLETILQLISSDSVSYYLPAIEIKDKPRFLWRGLMIDPCRHFIPVHIVKRNIDAMAAVKMNVMHWHLTEDQGFRIESKVHPKLHEMGSDGLYYTQEQIKDVVAYAADRGIRVMPEFDLPGHATSWLVGYPELASAPGPYEIERMWGIFDPTFDPTNEKVYEFLEAFFVEMGGLFPDAFWHIGGDENRGHQWDANPKIQKFMKENGLHDNFALQNYFNLRLEKMLAKLNKTMVGWYTDQQPDLNKNYIIQSWKGRKSLYESARNGYRCLLSHGFYIDLVQPTIYHYQNDPIPQDSVLKDKVAERILGGEATMWAEFVGPETIDSRIWPRTAAIAERLWSPGTVTDEDDMFRRLEIISFQFEELGLTHLKNYDMMLRRLANGPNIENLKNFTDAVKPLYTYSRDRPHVAKSWYPMTRVVDAVQPDPIKARKFNKCVENYLQDKKDMRADKIKSMLEIWQTNHSKLQSLFMASHILKEVEPLSSDLSKCAEIGLKSLNCLLNNKQMSETQFEKSKQLIEKARQPRGEAELAVLDGIEKLLNACK